ncbi:MAG: di-heme-cytochrome C peroxidase [Methylococcales bacterium]|nr:di-heme-cytochrome C peroxidase [Methylococcales bacterium]
MNNTFKPVKITGFVFALGFFASLPLLAAPASAPFTIDQGKKWTPEDRKNFYSQDQGSQIMPLSWIMALKQADGQPFMAANLSRYGYLPNTESNIPHLPVGFTTNGIGNKAIGITCSACHTRQIEVAGTSYRIDGGPAIVDFQGFLSDLDTAVNTILTDEKAFADFANAVLGASPSPEKQKHLHDEVSAWFLRYDTLMKASLPSVPWGPSRLDAVTMIFNRLTGLDIGRAPSYLIAENIKRADAPVRYPFLWNAPIQDKTQWPGFADNGDRVLGLSRNLGEVFGVFAVFHPKKDPTRLLGVDFLSDNSANFAGLNKLEDLIMKIGPPKWPWAVDKDLAAKGKAIYAKTCAASCHEIKKGAFRSLFHETWTTPIQDVGTDSREYNVLSGMVDTGVLNGANIPFLDNPLKPNDKAFNVLGMAVIGSIIQQAESVIPAADKMSGKDKQKMTLAKMLLRPELKHLGSLKGAFRIPAAALKSNTTASFAYEARVLEGVWATAPYLHNGSVPTLAELLKPVSERAGSFKIGPAYDTTNLGLAVDQTKFDYTLKTTDCSERNSGNSRCGHEFGTTLSPGDKKALLEYLKIL